MAILPEPAFLTYALAAGGGIKSGEPDIRKVTLAHGAVLLSFVEPPETPAIAASLWRAMEAKGFFITTDGCIFPHKYYWSSNEKGDQHSGHVRSIDFFVHRQRLQTGQNEFGWPANEQVSHLCHRENCVNPLHLTIEPQWCNLRRNFCGANGACSCGQQPACTQRFVTWNVFLEQVRHGKVGFISRQDEVLEVLSELRNAYKFKVRQKDHYRVEDEKRINRKARLAQGKIHQEQQTANLKRKVAKLEHKLATVEADKRGKDEQSDEESEQVPEPAANESAHKRKAPESEVAVGATLKKKKKRKHPPPPMIEGPAKA